MKKLVISLVMVNLLAACASSKQPAPVSAPANAPAAKAAVTGGAQTGAATTAATGAADLQADAAGIPANRSVFYPFDIDVVQDADKPLVQAHGQYLAVNPKAKVRLEGNCDERGSNEYNLALGQRRADGVKKMLELSGANASQLDSVSFGEEKPRASGHDEASWSQNRRTDINYKR